MASVDPIASSWRAHLAITLAGLGDRTVVRHRRHEGPLQVQRALYPEGEQPCHLYIVHPPGGVVGGDRLDLNIALEARAHALVTTPAAGKFYRSSAACAVQEQRLRVARGACLEWFPQESIVFDGARIATRTRVELDDESRFIGWEIACLGRPAAGERFTHGEARVAFELWRNSRPLWIERGGYEGGAAVLTAPWGLGGASVVGTLLCVTDDPGALAAVRDVWAGEHGALLAATHADGVLACRYQGTSADAAKALFIRAWAVLRPRVCGRAAQPPRIWLT
jgi:urease accessory protein